MKIKIYLYTIAATMMMSSCSGFLKEYSQDTDYVRSWEDLNELLIGDGYLPQFQSDYLSTVGDNQYFIHFLGDELDENTTTYSGDLMQYDGKERVFGYFTWQARSGQNDSYTGFNKENDNWEQIYKHINVANNIIFSAKDLSEATQSDKLGKEKVDGEARFLRAYYYFFLVNLYGKAYTPNTASTDLGVPIKTSETVEDKSFQRNTVQECYDLILSDLQTAETELTEYGSQKSIYRADSTAVNFLLSRVYLYMQNWKKASEYAQKVIDSHPDLLQLNSLQQNKGIVSTSSVENIFSMGSNALCDITLDQYKSFTITDSIYNLYSDNDLRKTKFFWTYGKFHGYKKLDMVSTSLTQTEDMPDYYFYAYESPWSKRMSDMSDKFLFRSSEAYLTKAEAEAYMGHEEEARTLINTLRQYRYKPGTDYKVTASGEDLVKLIRDERERELCLEGQRWFDLRRYGVCEKYPESKSITHHYYYYVDRQSSVKTSCHTFTLEPNDWGYVLPIPHETLTTNTGMQDNVRGDRTYKVETVE